MGVVLGILKSVGFKPVSFSLLPQNLEIPLFQPFLIPLIYVLFLIFKCSDRKISSEREPKYF